MASITTPPHRISQAGGSATRKKSASPWRIVRFSPYITPNPLNISNSVIPRGLPLPNPLQRGSPRGLDDPIDERPEKVVRLTLSFSLLKQGIPRSPSEVEIAELQKHFPTITHVSFLHPFLKIRVERLPRHPWPTFVADLPVWIYTDNDEPDFELGQTARAVQKFTVEGSIRYCQDPEEATVLEIFELLNNVGAGIDTLRWDGCVFRAFGGEIPPEGWQSRLPRSINGFSICFFWTRTRMIEHAVRMKMPTASTTDDTDYRRSTLRPGIMLSGARGTTGETLGTTAGVCVELVATGQKFITVAAHGFPDGVGAPVYHPYARLANGEPDDRCTIGTISKKFGDTDIALAQLKPGLAYSRETFAESEETQLQTRPFGNLKDGRGLRTYDPVFMDTPVNGRCEGAHIETEWQRITGTSGDATQQEWQYLEIAHFSYWGNGSDIFFEGCCGGVVWDENFDVLGQFRFQEKDGKKRAFAPSFKILADNGYRLSDVGS